MRENRSIIFLLLITFLCSVGFAQRILIDQDTHALVIQDNTNYVWVYETTYQDSSTYTAESVWWDHIPVIEIVTTEIEAILQINRTIDEGTKDAPSKWYIQGSTIYQVSNIYSLPDDRDSLSKFGSMVLTGNYSRLSVKCMDDDGIGVVFRYIDSQNYFRFSLDRQRKYRRVVQFSNGIASLIAEDSSYYIPGQPFEIRFHNGIMVNNLMFYPLADDAQGQGLYTWGSSSTQFYAFKALSVTTSVTDKIIEHIVEYTVTDYFDSTSTWQIPHNPTTWYIQFADLNFDLYFDKSFDTPEMKINPDNLPVGNWLFWIDSIDEVQGTKSSRTRLIMVDEKHNISINEIY